MRCRLGQTRGPWTGPEPPDTFILAFPHFDMAHNQPIELKFTGGGPMDGHAFICDEARFEESFVVDGGRYRLWDTAPPLMPGVGAPTAYYRWLPWTADEDQLSARGGD